MALRNWTLRETEERAQMARVDGPKDEGKFEKRTATLVVRRPFERYYLLCQLEKDFLSGYFLDEEWKILRDLSKNVLWDPVIRVVDGVYNIVFQKEDSYFTSFSVGKNQLLKKLKKINTGQKIVLVEMLEEWRDLNW